MSINRRAFVTAATAGALWTQVKKARAQSVPPPTADDLGAMLKGDPKEYARMLLGVDALTRITALLLLRRGTGDDNLSRWFEIRQPFADSRFAVQAGQKLPAASLAEIAKVAGDEVKPTAARIEQFLAEGGLIPGKELERDMLRGFYLFVQLKAVVDQKAVPAKQAWYCDVYPFSVFCKAAA